MALCICEYYKTCKTKKCPDIRPRIYGTNIYSHMWECFDKRKAKVNYIPITEFQWKVYIKGK
jgi:hypothetical protein